jgi:hypothetical protein
MTEAGGLEETPTLTALMLGIGLQALGPMLSSAAFPPAMDAFVRGAAGVGVFLASQLGLTRGLRGASGHLDLAARAEAALNPLQLLGGLSLLEPGSAYVYGCALSAGIPEQEALVRRLSAAAVEDLEADLSGKLKEDAELARKAEAAVAMAGLTDLLRRAALLAEAGQVAPDVAEPIFGLYFDPRRLQALLGDEGQRKTTAKALGRAAMSELGSALKDYSPKEPAAALGLSRPDARERYAEAAMGALADLWLARGTERAQRLFAQRTGNESEGGLEAEYQAGRLYRISTADAPILKTNATPLTAALFVDVKDFTRRTSLLGQAVMADFLRTSFYLPILDAAKKHLPKGGAERGDITLNNLLGDAASLSGRIDALMALALDIRRHLAELERELRRRVPTERVEEALRAVERSYANKLQSVKGPAARGELERARELALARARGEGLEASVFISYGPSPLVIAVDDDLFGHAKVAIADRINESARGTARAPGARARADAALRSEREQKRQPLLQHAWAVFVDAPLLVSVPLDAEESARDALRRGDLPRAQEAVLGPVQEALRGLGNNAHEPSGDIYNAGAAVSEEALKAFEAAMGNARVFVPLVVPVDSLHAELRSRYFFCPSVLRMTAAFHPTGELAELFRYAGGAMFKGLERQGGIPVWELVGDEALLGLMKKHHAKDWFHRQKGAAP